MPINRLLVDTSLGPEEIGRLNDAFQCALRALSLVDRNDRLTEIVAEKVIKIGLNGIREPKAIAEAVVKELGLP